MVKAPQWQNILSQEFEAPYFKELIRSIEQDAKTYRVYPERENCFKAFDLCDYDQVKVVILGQDPYHGPEQATGLAFAVPNDYYPKPPSLQNIMKELGVHTSYKSSLTGWAEQGVFLLNTFLTVRAKAPLSHATYGWEVFTDNVIKALNRREQPIVFLLWGKSAKAKADLINNPNHSILVAAHPSPLSAHNGFFGCDHFPRANLILQEHGYEPIDWRRTE